MWNDWHSEVRRASAQCLGKTGHGREVHDNLRIKILEGDEKVKLEALNKVGQLGKLTSQEVKAKMVLSDFKFADVLS